MLAVKVQVQKNDIWSVWVGPTREGIEREIRSLRSLFAPEPIEEIPLAIAQQVEHYEVIASAVMILAERHNVGGLLLGRLLRERA